MGGIIGGLFGGDGVPEVEVKPASIGGVFNRLGAVVVIGSARIPGIVMQVAVLDISDEDGSVLPDRYGFSPTWLVDQFSICRRVYFAVQFRRE